MPRIGPGHDSGHDAASSSPFTWKTYVDGLVAEFGGWTHLADELIRRANNVVEIGQDLQSVEKGLRRLSRRDNQNGGQYGRWILRFFGVPTDVTAWVRGLAQYHRGAIQKRDPRSIVCRIAKIEFG